MMLLWCRENQLLYKLKAFQRFVLSFLIQVLPTFWKMCLIYFS